PSCWRSSPERATTSTGRPPSSSIAPTRPAAATTSPRCCSRSPPAELHQPDEAHVHAAVEAVAAEGEEALGVAAGAGGPVVDVLGAHAGALQLRAGGQAQVDVLLARPVDHHAGLVAEGAAELVDHLAAHLEAAGADRRPERHPHV